MSNETGAGRWSLNLQTVTMLVGIAGILVAWGYTLSALQTDTDRNTAAVAALTLGLEQNDSKTDQLEIRMKTVERIAEDAAALRHELDGAMSQVKADLAVIKSILQRAEKNGRQPP